MWRVLWAATVALIATGASVNAEETRAHGTAASGPVTVTGTLKLVIALTAGPAMPDGTPVSINVNINVGDAAYRNTSYVFTSSAVAGGRADVTIDVPYKWRLSSTSDVVDVSISANGNASAASDTYSYSTNFNVPSASTTTVRATGSI